MGQGECEEAIHSDEVRKEYKREFLLEYALRCASAGYVDEMCVQVGVKIWDKIQAEVAKNDGVQSSASQV